MEKNIISVKKMTELYVNYGLDENTWTMLYQMTCHGLISNENWHKFYNKCKGWYFDKETNSIVDSDTEIVIYSYDDKGNLHKW